MDTKHIHCMLEDMAEYGKEMISCAVGSGNVNLDDAEKIIDIVKDLADAEYHALIAKEMRKAHEDEEAEEKYMKMKMKEEHADEYRRYIDEYGEDGERRFYDAWRYKTSGRFAPRGKGERYGSRGYEEPPYMHIPEDYRMNLADYKGKTAEELRDLDRSKGKLYYTDPDEMGNVKREEGRYDKARRGYSESKQMHKSNSPEDNSENMRNLEKILNIIAEDVKEYMPNMSTSEKAMAKQKIEGISKSIQ